MMNSRHKMLNIRTKEGSLSDMLTRLCKVCSTGVTEFVEAKWPYSPGQLACLQLVDAHGYLITHACASQSIWWGAMYVSPQFNSSTSTTEQQYQVVCKYLLRSHRIDSEQKNPKSSLKKLNANACLSHVIYISHYCGIFLMKIKSRVLQKKKHMHVQQHASTHRQSCDSTERIMMTLHLWPFEDQRTRKQPKLHWNSTLGFEGQTLKTQTLKLGTAQSNCRQVHVYNRRVFTNLYL